MIKNKTLVFIHQNFPGQFLHLCRRLAADNTIYFITKKTKNRIPKVRLLEYELKINPELKPHSYLRSQQDAVFYGQAAARMLLMMKQKKIRPDIIVGHCGWGETIFVKDVFPEVPLLSYFEFFYAAEGGDAELRQGISRKTRI